MQNDPEIKVPDMIDFKKIKAIIFDMDGVIVDSEHIHKAAELEACRHFGIDAPIEEWEKFKGRTLKYIADYLIKKYASRKIKPHQFAKKKTDLYLEMAPKKIAEIPGAVDFIKKAKKKNFCLCLATSSLDVIRKLVFKKYNLHPYFSFVTTADEVAHGKPHPEPYLKTVAKSGFLPAECAVIEDSDNGIISAKSAGCHAIGITTSFGAEKLAEVGADLVVGGFDEIYERF